MNLHSEMISICLQRIPTCVKTCWLHNINLVEALKLVKYHWTKSRNLDGILDEIGDFGRTENEILDSVFVQSLMMLMYCMSLHGDVHAALSGVVVSCTSTDPVSLPVLGRPFCPW